MFVSVWRQRVVIYSRQARKMRLHFVFIRESMWSAPAQALGRWCRAERGDLNHSYETWMVSRANNGRSSVAATTSPDVLPTGLFCRVSSPSGGSRPVSAAASAILGPCVGRPGRGCPISRGPRPAHLDQRRDLNLLNEAGESGRRPSVTEGAMMRVHNDAIERVMVV